MLSDHSFQSMQDRRLQTEVERVLSSVRRHLSMEVGFVSEIRDDRRVFRFVDRESDIPVRAGDSDPLAESYCHHVIRGQLPPLLKDAQENPVAGSIKATRDLPVGAHISVPIRLPNGSIFGTFCCFSRQPSPALGENELEVVRVAADIVSSLIEDAIASGRELAARRRRIDDIIEDRSLTMVYQPIYRLADNRLMNFEALARFPGEPATPDILFKEAAGLGRGPALELMAVEEALKGLLGLPRQASLSLNLSPEAIFSDAFEALFDDLPCQRLIIELTEHEPVSDYEALRNRLARYRSNGLRLAIDDVGAGYASFRHILDLHPDLIKLDTVLTRSIDTDIARQTLAKAITMFGRKMGCEVVAEGVETTAELDTLRAIGATKVQGYLIGRPMPLADAAQLPALIECKGRKINPRPRLAGLRTAS